MKKAIIVVLTFIGLLLIVFGIHLTTKFKNIEVELGTSIDSEKLVSYGSTKDVNIDLSKIDINKVGKYNVPLQYMFIKYDLEVNVVDKTPPVLEVKDISETLDYVVDVNDFIVNVSDKSKYDVSYHGDIDTSKYGEYNVNIIAKDIYNNSETKQAKLSIGWVKSEYTVEVGNIIKKEDLLYDSSDIDTISQSELDEINKKTEGVYYLNSVKGNDSVKIKIEKLRDITPPELVLKKVTIYDGKKIKDVSEFVSKATDKNSRVSLKLLTDINYKKIGEQKIVIEAFDEDGNKVTKETTLKIIKDKEGPKISGLTKITIDKGTIIDYRKGVSSHDNNTGACEFDVDTSKVDTSKYGTYYAIYTSSDSFGNKTTSKRVISVNHDENDTNEKIKEIANTLSNDVEKIRDYVRNNIKYNTNWGGDDPVWYGLTKKLGNCFVHAKIFDVLLKAKGYETKLIWTTDKTHYWNMVYLNGKWVHMDSTPSSRHNKYSIMNDAKRYERLQGRNWDRSLWPKAE